MLVVVELLVGVGGRSICLAHVGGWHSRSKWVGGDWLFVEFDEEVEVTERVLAIFFDVFANVGN